MRGSLLLIAVRAATAIAVSTAAVQFWAIAVKGETPRLTPSIALPPTASAFAAVVPHRPAKPKGAKHKAHPRSASQPKSAQAQPATPSSRPATTPPDTLTPVSPSVSSAKTRPTPVKRPAPAPKQAAPAPKAKPAPKQPPAPVQPVLTRPPAFPELAPVAPPPPSTDD